MRKKVIYLVAFLLIQSCAKFDWTNPYDPLCPKSNYTPSSFSAIQSGSTIILSWPQVNNNIGGYIIQRQLASGTGSRSSIATIAANVTQYIDADIVGGQSYKYFLLAYAGTNQSNEVSTQVTYTVKPTVNTAAPTLVSSDSASFTSNITSNGGSPITASGICWGTNPAPTVSNEKTVGVTLSGSFTAYLTNLIPETKYYARAYATNVLGTSYGEEQSFTTKAVNVSGFTWTSVYPGESYTFIRTPTVNSYFLVAKNSVQKSINGGTSWSSTNWTANYTRDGLSTTSQGGSYSSFGSGNLVIGSLDNGFYHSVNSGTDYTNSGPVGYACSSQSIVALSDGRFLASMGGFQRGIWKTSGTNNNTWSNKLPGNDPTDFSIASNGTIYSSQRSPDATGPVLVKSIDNGENWIAMYNAKKELEDCEAIADSLMWVDHFGNLYMTSASSPNFNVGLRYNISSGSRTVSSSLTDVDLIYYPSKKIVVATSSSGIYVSGNNGMTWTNYKISGVSAYYNVSYADGYIYVCTKEGLYRTKY